MVVLPIVNRELLVRARQPATYRVRWLAAGLALLVAVPMLLGQSRTPALLGKELFAALSVLALAWCLFEGARQTADCLSEERREGTLGLLFLTDLTGWDVVLGKLAAASLNSFYSLLATMPVLGLPLLAGGVTGGEFARVTLALGNTLFFALAVGMWVSSRQREEMKSLFTALGWVVAMVALPVLLDVAWRWPRFAPALAGFSLASPGFSWFLALDATYRTAAREFWLSVGLGQGMSWGLLLAAAWNVRRGLREDGDFGVPRIGKDETKSAGRTGRSARRRRLLERNPIRWLAERERGALPWVWLAAGAMVLVAGMQGLVFRWLGLRLPMLGLGLWGHAQTVTGLAVRFLIAYLACRFIGEAKRTGTLELLLCAPLRRADILRGQQAALWHLLLWPLAAALVLQTFLPSGVQPWSLRPLALVGLVLRALQLAADALALGWFGAWAALHAPRPAAAVARTFVLAALVPWVVESWLTRLLNMAVVPRYVWLWFYLLGTTGTPLLMDAGFIWWARRKLRREFCGAAAGG